MKKILFIVILLVAAGFRLFMLSTVPPSQSLEEVTIGWNAYSILQTGHDEYGYHMPVLLRGYDDYRPALYVYTVIPFILLFGLTGLAVRLPAALMSIATVAMSFFLIRSMLQGYKKKDVIAFCTMGLFAISPWNIYVSRLGIEVNLGLMLVVLATLLFFLALEYKKASILVWSFVVFALSFYGYQSEKVFTPLFLVVLLIAYHKRVLAFGKYLLFGIIAACIVLLPIFFATLSPGALLRIKATSIFIDNPAYSQNAKQLLVAKEKHDIVGELLTNRRITPVEIFLKNYSLHFNPIWLFTGGYDMRYKAPQSGLLYLWELPFIIFGLFVVLFNRKIHKSIKSVIIFWILISFIPSGIATQAPHGVRSLTLLPMPQLLTSIGLITFVGFLLSKTTRVITIACIFFLAVIATQATYRFGYDYFALFPVVHSEEFAYAVPPAIAYINQNKNDYKTVVVSSQDNLSESYMFYLFYTKYDPKKYAQMGGTKRGGFNDVHIIGNVVFRPIVWEKEDMQGTLFVGNPDDFPTDANMLLTTYYLDGTKGVTIIKGK